MELYKHQKEFLEKNPNRAIVSHEAGLGKSRTACEWLKLRADRPAIVIATKATKKKWYDELKKWGVTHDVLVVTKEEFKKETNIRPVVVVDECQNFSSPLFIARMRSQMSEHLYNYIKPDSHVLLMSANVIRSTPWNMHTLMTYAGYYVDYKAYQDKYFELIRRPYLPRPAWEPKKGWQKMMQPLINKYCDVAIMPDCVDVPIHEYQTYDIPLWDDTKKKIEKIKQEEWEPMAIWTGIHRAENGGEKLEWIKQFGEGVKKVVVVCHYREQLDQYAKELSKQKQVFILHGGVKDQHTPVQEAQASDECYFLVQASMGVGFDLDKFSVMVFASLGYSYLFYSQMKGRINRIHNLHRNQYIHLIGGKHDKAVYDKIKEGFDFDPTAYIAKEAK